MRIIFGTYSFKLKAVDVSKFNLKIGEDNLCEIRQEVFHIFFIPFFPTGKEYGVRKAKDFHKLSVEAKKVFKSKYKPRTPWYSFSGLIIGVLVFGCIAGSDYLSHMSIMKQREQDKLAMIDKFEQPKVHDVYRIYVTAPNQDWQNRNHYMRVEKHSADSIYFKISVQDDVRRNGYKIDHETYFNEPHIGIRVGWCTASELKQAYLEPGKQIPTLFGLDKVWITTVYRIN